MRALVLVAVLLWLVTPVPLLLANTAPSVPVISDIARVADIARDKDVVWLSLAMAIVSICFSAWLVYRRDKMIEGQTKALLESAKATSAVAAALQSLKDELENERLRDRRN